MRIAIETTKGNFNGLVARGNVVVDAWWESGRLLGARISPRVNGEVVIVTGKGYFLRGEDGTVFDDVDGRFQLRLTKGAICTLGCS